MRQTSRVHSRLLIATRTALLLACATWLAACSAPGLPRGEPPSPTQQLDALLAQADAAHPLQAGPLRVDALELALRQGDKTRAASIAARVDASLLAGDPLARYSLYQARERLAERDAEGALTWLQAEPLRAAEPNLPAGRRYHLLRLRGEALGLQGQAMGEIATLVDALPLAPDDATATRLSDRLWKQLLALPAEELEQARLRSRGDTLDGWLQLAGIARQSDAGLEQQLAALERWTREWQDHPAARQPPSELALVREAARNRPTRIALLLPLSGRLTSAGLELREGFMAAYYQSLQEGAQVPRVDVHDTAAGTDITTLYQKAVAEGAQLVVGPLDKDDLRKLHALGPLPVPTLALNRLEGQTPPANLYQFSLAIEDEARFLATAAQPYYQQALLLRPPGDIGQRAASSFSAQWRQQGGIIAGDLTLDEGSDTLKRLRSALGLDDSAARHSQLQALLGRELAFTPRHRPDIDMIVLVARPNTARVLVPTLAFLYASDLPVLSTSMVWSGTQEPPSNTDLEGLAFSDIPWLFDTGALRKQVTGTLGPAARDSRLFAMGVDAFRLYARLPQMAALPQARLDGATGRLSLDTERRLQREPILARFQQGVARRTSTARP